MRIDARTDIICPFCTIAKAELDTALASLPHADAVTVVPRSYELHPGAPVEPTTDYLEKKYGWSPALQARQCDNIDARARLLGLTYNWRPSKDVSDHGVLREVAASVGLDASRVDEVLGSDEFADAVAADTAEARHHGVTGTPFFLIDGQYALSGAQPAEAFGDALTRVWAETHPVTPLINLGLGDAGPACGQNGCA